MKNSSKTSIIFKWSYDPEESRRNKEATRKLRKALENADRIAAKAIFEAWAMLESDLATEQLTEHVSENNVFLQWSLWSRATKSIKNVFLSFFEDLGVIGEILEAWTPEGATQISPHYSGPVSIFPDKVSLDGHIKLEFKPVSSGYSVELEAPFTQASLDLVFMQNSTLVEEIELKIGKTTISSSTIEKADRVLIVRR